MIGRRLFVIMQFFQIVNEVVYSLGIKELKNRSANESNPTNALLHTFRITCDGSVLSMAFRYCCMAVS